jgi:hypothetical protein
MLAHAFSNGAGRTQPAFTFVVAWALFPISDTNLALARAGAKARHPTEKIMCPGSVKYIISSIKRSRPAPPANWSLMMGMMMTLTPVKS